MSNRERACTGEKIVHRKGDTVVTPQAVRPRNRVIALRCAGVSAGSRASRGSASGHLRARAKTVAPVTFGNPLLNNVLAFDHVLLHK